MLKGRFAWIALNLIPNITPNLMRRLCEVFVTVENIFKASLNELLTVPGINSGIASSIFNFQESEIEKEIKEAEKHCLKIITLMDEEYPLNLKTIADPPPVLYVKGELKKEDKFSIAIVGSRQATLYGLECSQHFAKELAGLGFTIVSGFARGIDTWAHKGALQAKGRTIAVLGSGFNFIYPQENMALLEEIILNGGAVISEFPCNSRPLSFNFPRRNRIISGLSLGVLVVEAAKKSGALITANLALEQNREVFCIPGRQDSFTSRGTNTLIKEGAKLVLDIEDILEELPVDLKV